MRKPAIKPEWLALFLLVTAAAAVIRGIRAIHAPDLFVDEVNFAQSAANLLQHGSYAPDGWMAYDPKVSTGFWCTLPSGVAQLAGASVATVRAVSYLFALVLLWLAGWVALGTQGRGRLPIVERAALATTACVLVANFVPYRVGLFRTLGEFPAVAYFGIGLALIQRQRVRWGCFFLGVSVFGGKWVMLAFAAPVLAFLLIAQSLTPRKWFEAVGSFLVPAILNALLIVVTQGFGFYLDWLESAWGSTRNYQKLAAGQLASAPARLGLMERLQSPQLEWAGYPWGIKIKILLLLFGPVAWIGFRFWRGKRPNLKTLGLELPIIAGQMVFAIWYFGLHPYMWIRHLQPALIVGMGIGLWTLHEHFPRMPVRGRGLVWVFGFAVYFCFRAVGVP